MLYNEIVNLLNSVMISGVCVAALALSGCATNQDTGPVSIPLDKEKNHSLLEGLGSLSNKLTDKPLPTSDWGLLPPEVQGSSLLKPTDAARQSQGIVSGKVYSLPSGEQCVILYLGRVPAQKVVGVTVGTYTDKDGSQEYILDNLTGAQARDYPAHHYPCR